MRKQKFKKLFTVALPADLYDLVKELSDQHEISMGEVVRSSIKRSMTLKNKHTEEGTAFSFKDTEL